MIESNTPNLNIDASTNVPVAPQKVEDIVSVDAFVTDTITRHLVDTVKQVAPYTPKDEAPIARIVRGDSTLVAAPRTSATAPIEGAVDNTLPTTIIPPMFSLDTIAYPMLRDSLVADTVSVAKKSMSTYSLDAQKQGVALPVKLDRSDGVFALLLVCFLLLAHIYNGGIAFFKENIMLVFSATKSEKLESQTATKENFYSYFLVFLAALLIAISLYEALSRFMPLGEDQKRPFATIGIFVVAILSFILLKMLFNKFVGYIFDFDKRLNVWNRSYLVLLSIFGLLCFLPTLMLVYSSLWNSIIIGFVLILFLIVQLILFVRIIVFFIEQKFSFLYLIAYLCTIEILPYIFLAIGLIYLYRIDIFNTIL